LLCLSAGFVVVPAAAACDHQHGCGKPSDYRRGYPDGVSSQSAHFPSSSPSTATV
jgi:hypothetical protein